MKCCCLCYHDLMNEFDFDEADAQTIMDDPELAETARGFVESRRASKASLAAAQQAFDDLQAAIHR